MNKIRAKWVWQSLGLSTPPFVVAPPGSDIHALTDRLEFPLVVKPACEGSSMGVTRVFAAQDLAAAVALADAYPGEVMIERLIDGDEYTVAILGQQVLPSIHIVPGRTFYDYNAKYRDSGTDYRCPGLTGKAETDLHTLVWKAFDALGCHGWGRVDVMRDRAGNNWLLEINTAPGMTSHSLVPRAAAVVDMDYATLCWRILETSLREDP